VHSCAESQLPACEKHFLISSFGSKPVQINSILKSCDSQLHWTARCLIRVCLLLSLWNLPFPWIHNHDLNQVADSSSYWLPTHLDEFHATVSEESSEEGWHLHFVYFGGENSNNPLKNKFPPQHYFIVGESSQTLPACESAQTTLLQQVLAAHSLSPAFSPAGITPAPLKEPVVVEHFLQSFPSKSFRDLISVSLC